MMLTRKEFTDRLGSDGIYRWFELKYLKNETHVCLVIDSLFEKRCGIVWDIKIQWDFKKSLKKNLKTKMIDILEYFESIK